MKLEDAKDLYVQYLYVEAEVDHVAVLHHIVLALAANKSFFLGCRH